MGKFLTINFIHMKKFFTRDISKVFLGMAMAGLFLGANSGIAQKVKLNPIKPAVNQAQPLTDEQQGILAVRTVKAAVVNILGTGGVISNGRSQAVNSVYGTGFIISSDGYIVSNNHVVQDANLKYTVVFADGTQYDAKVVGLDKYDDVALLKIDANNLPVAKLGNSDALETGQTVFAIGNSLGKYQNSVTKGVVSGLGRDVSVGDNDGTLVPRLKNLVQTDASISRGNSGGPLINLAGEVIGMSTVIDTEGQGLGFAVAVNIIKSAVEQLKASGKVSKSYLGINFSTVTPAVKALKNLNVSEGALILEIVTGSPAHREGLKIGDVITLVNGEKITTVNELDKVVGKYKPGNQILVTLVRGGQILEMPVVLGELK